MSGGFTTDGNGGGFMVSAGYDKATFPQPNLAGVYTIPATDQSFGNTWTPIRSGCVRALSGRSLGTQVTAGSITWKVRVGASGSTTGSPSVAWTTGTFLQARDVVARNAQRFAAGDLIQLGYTSTAALAPNNCNFELTIVVEYDPE